MNTEPCLSVVSLFGCGSTALWNSWPIPPRIFTKTGGSRHSRERPVQLGIAPECRPRTAVFTRHAVHAAAENAPHAFTVGTQASTREFLVQAASRLLEGCLLFRLRTAAQFHHGICQCEHLLHEGPKIR